MTVRRGPRRKSLATRLIFAMITPFASIQPAEQQLFNTFDDSGLMPPIQHGPSAEGKRSLRAGHLGGSFVFVRVVKLTREDGRPAGRQLLRRHPRNSQWMASNHKLRSQRGLCQAVDNPEFGASRRVVRVMARGRMRAGNYRAATKNHPIASGHFKNSGNRGYELQSSLANRESTVVL